MPSSGDGCACARCRRHGCGRRLHLYHFRCGDSLGDGVLVCEICKWGPDHLSDVERLRRAVELARERGELLERWDDSDED